MYPGWDGLQAGVDLLVEAVLVPLSAGRPAQVPRYDWLVGAIRRAMAARRSRAS